MLTGESRTRGRRREGHGVPRGDAGPRSADPRRLVLHDVALVHELARQKDARETAVSMKDRPPGWRQGAARGRIFVGSQVPGVTRMCASGDLEADAGSGG